MPFINTKTNLPMDAEREASIKSKFGEAITCIRGKSEQWLMVGFEPEYHLWFQGSAAPAALVEVNVYGSAGRAEYEALTGKICDILHSELKLSPDRIYVKYIETPNWGWNGQNF